MRWPGGDQDSFSAIVERRHRVPCTDDRPSALGHPGNHRARLDGDDEGFLREPTRFGHQSSAEEAALLGAGEYGVDVGLGTLGHHAL